MVLGRLPVPGRPTSLDCGRAGDLLRLRWVRVGLFGLFFLSFVVSLFFSHPLGDGPIWTEMLSQRAVKPKITNQPTNFEKAFDTPTPS